MDAGLPVILRQMRELDEPRHAAHEGDSALYVHLAMCAMDINEVCQRARQDIDRVGLMMATAMLDIETHLQARRITREQRDRLLHLLKEDMEEPTAENNVPVFKLRFPSPDYDPPPRAA